LTAGAERGGAAATRRCAGARLGWSLAWVEAVFAGVAFAVLCVLVLRLAPQLAEPDDYAYRASIVAMTRGHFLTLSSAQAHALDGQLGGPPGLGVIPVDQ
jgi:hypothetical protein